MRRSPFQSTVTIIIAFLVSGLVTIGFSFAFYNGSYHLMQSKISLVPNIDHISVDDAPKSGEITDIIIVGFLCCPCYSIYSHTIGKVDLYNREIQIFLWQQKISEVCVQIIVKYEYLFEFIFLFSGNWTIKINSEEFFLYIS